MIKDERRKKKKRKRVLVTFLVILLLLATSALIVVKVFTVKTVKVEGNKLYQDKQIEDWVLNDKYSWNSLYVYLKYKFFDTKQVPFIDTMEVSLKSPHTIGITVYEKGLLGYIYMDSLGQNIYFDKDGFVVETSTDVIPGVPKIAGISCSKVVLYEKLNLDDKKALKTLLDITLTLKKYKLVPDSINYQSADAVTMTYGTVLVNLGDTKELTEKVKRLVKIMPSLSGLTGTLHLEEWTSDTTDITFEKAQ
jgi:cell division protein FtsQ